VQRLGPADDYDQHGKLAEDALIETLLEHRRSSDSVGIDLETPVSELQLDESFTGKNKSWSAIVKLIALTAMCVKGVIDLEKQVIELRREVRSRAEV
jgi:hypothetical protein